MLRRTNERDAQQLGAAHDIPVRVAALGWGLHRSDETRRVEKAAVHGGPHDPVDPVITSELVGARQRQVGIGRNEVEVETDSAWGVL